MRLTAPIHRLDHELRMVSSRRGERRFDRSLGVSTAGISEASANAPADPLSVHAVHYQGVPVRRLTAILEALPIEPGETTFVDYGCGKGKALLLAAMRGFRRVIGVEFAPGLAAVAQRNAEVLARARPDAARVEVACLDAAEYGLPVEPTVLFLYNPFDDVVMRRVAAAVDRSLAEDPRPMLVVYLHPCDPEPWDRAPRLSPLPVAQGLACPEQPGLFRRLRRYERGSDLGLNVYTSSSPADRELV
ncbi:MAG: hypothetical protein JWM71_2326 [Solirubrobacteraceae bacterium]|nr:hypothetical protein [Solirubrobacteraceae bacterium]